MGGDRGVSNHMTTPDWPAFLTARLDDEERVYDAAEGVWSARDLRIRRADIAAKRAILDDHYSHYVFQPGPVADLSNRTIKHLCRPFADHDDWPGE